MGLTPAEHEEMLFGKNKGKTIKVKINVIEHTPLKSIQIKLTRKETTIDACIDCDVEMVDIYPAQYVTMSPGSSRYECPKCGGLKSYGKMVAIKTVES